MDFILNLFLLSPVASPQAILAKLGISAILNRGE